MPESTIQFTVPALYESLMTPEPGLTIEHAAIPSRIPELLLASVIAEPIPGKVVIFSPNYKRWSIKIEEWCYQAGIRPKRRVGGYVIGGMTIFSILAGEDLPDSYPERIFVFDADKLDKPPALGLDDVTIYAGGMAARGHWYYIHCRRLEKTGKLKRFTGEQIANAFNSHSQLLMKKRDLVESDYRRLIELKDVVEKSDKTPFSRFARERLVVRSDKHGDHLNTVQRQQQADHEGTALVSFYLSRMQKRYLAMKRQALRNGMPPRFLLLKYRRGGFTTLEQGLNYEMATRRPNSYVVTLAHNATSTQRIFGISKLYAQNDPKKIGVKENQSRLDFNNGSMFFIGTAGSSGFGRGDTLQRVHGSEVAFWCDGPNQHARVNELISGLTGAASNGEVVLETTPNGVEWFAETYNDAKKGQNQWSPIFLPWFADKGNRHHPDQYNIEELSATLREDEKDLIKKHRLNLGQISFRREMQKEHKALFPQEYPEDDITCFLTSGTAYFDLQRIDFLLSRTIPVPKRIHVPGGELLEWEPPIPGEYYVLGADTSEGIKGQDLNGYGIMHRDSGRQVAALHGLFSPTALAKFIMQGAGRYNEALCGVERNNHGHAVIKGMVDSGWHHPSKLYHFQENRPGWDTNSLTRPVMLNGLADALSDRPAHGDNRPVWCDIDFLGECRTFKLQSNGGFAADQGAKDDRVIKWAICEQMRAVRRRSPSISFSS